ncbi:putative 3-transmembrane protein A13 [Trypanosoma conorhini]|uniref:Putative 3-transmembrane protein A13 n=1 Tax=Trypanosoma conorhini TaxID=83891 RepID=A0A3R7LMB9_9TRYP|nr:putative 3-transmembrane protein A13 [Trypanosoma conorhini]RNF17247.1 putative 3-transmembrane protein A13 [Trypanosoma conorhini]
MARGDSARGRRCVCLLVFTLLCALRASVTADSAVLTDPATGEVVLLTPGKMHSSVASRSPVVGLWPHGDGRDDDTAFFRAEDDAYEQWVARKRQREREQQRRHGTGGGGKGGEATKGTQSNSKKTRKSRLERFSAEAVRTRNAARRQRLKELTNTSLFELAWNEIRADTDLLKDFVYEASSFAPQEVPGATPEEQYSHLLKTVFRHTLRNMTQEKRSVWIENWLYALPYPMLLDGRTVGNAEREVRNIKEYMSRVDSAQRTANVTENDVGNVNYTKQLIRENLCGSAEMLNASRAAHRMVIELALPLLPHFRQSVTTQLRDVNAQIVGNDESTALLRQQLKEWTRRKSNLKASNEKVTRVESELRRAVYGKTLLPEDAFIFSLALIAKLRLGQNTGMESVDVATDLGTCVSLTAAQEAELKAALYRPFGIGLLAVATLSWALLGSREFWLKRVRRSLFSLQRTTEVSGHSRGKFSLVRLCLRVNLLIEACVPLIVPTFSLYAALNRKNEGPSLYHVFLFSRPAQRLMLAGVVVVLYLLSLMVFSLMGALYNCSSTTTPRRKLKKP